MKPIHKYFIYSSLNSFVTSVENVVGTNSMLSSINSPSHVGTLSLMSVSYIGKDIIGQLGCLAFSWRWGKYADKNPLFYMTQGTALLQVGFYLDTFSPMISPNYILPYLGLSSIIKNIAFISIGAVTANNLKKLNDSGASTANRIGELYSRSASINTISSTIGMLVGLGIIKYVPNPTSILPILSICSIYCSRQATKIN